MTPLLLVEPVPDLQRLLVASLHAHGYTVVAVANGDQALRHLAAARRPAVILMDVTEPIPEGRRLVDALSADPEQRGIPVVLLSSVCEASRDVPPGTVAVLIGRPVRTEVLLQVLDRICRPQRHERLESQVG
jgi:CheY-like chemotaxis protein